MQVSLPADLAAYLPELSIAAPLLQPGITTEIPVPISSPVPGGETAFQPSATQEPVPTFLPTETPFLPPTDTPTLAPSPTPLPTETPMPSPTPTLEPTPMPSATLAPASATPLPQPTRKPKKKAAAASPSFRPENVQVNDRWVDVDLSSQTTYAMEGNQVMRSFIVSTGRYPTVTVTGAYKIYVKYRTANMSGDDYFLPNVPYVMYFFKGYGLHGTYWHNNFGTPMSHGCVNFRPEDAAWLFDFASVGTIVNVHP
jgi:lipoprotein-anchoring transpeptidase ErfK/SrfK